MSETNPMPVPEHVPPELLIDYAFGDQLGVDRCPYAANAKIHDLPNVFFTRQAYRTGGSWIVTSAEYIREAYTNPEIFSSNNATGFLRLLGKDINLIPVEVDPPLHRLYRSIINGRFTPAAMNPMEDSLRERAREMIRGLLSKDQFEFEAEYGRPYPVRIFLDLMALPTERLDEFVQWEDQLLHGGSIEIIAQGAQNIMSYLEEVIPERKKNLGDDLLSTIIQGTIDDRPITDDEIFAMSFLLFFGGLDTVAATMTFIFKHLAEHPEDQALLRAEPELIPGAVEEFLRAYSVVSSPRVVAQDVDFHGVKMKVGDRIMLASTMAGRDPEAFENADKVDLRRKNVRHLAFASGPHICVGAPLARRELRISLEEWMKLAPPFAISPDDCAVTRGQGVFDVKRLPLVWTGEAEA
jgi:cytochrome P450